MLNSFEKKNSLKPSKNINKFTKIHGIATNERPTEIISDDNDLNPDTGRRWLFIHEGGKTLVRLIRQWDAGGNQTKGGKSESETRGRRKVQATTGREDKATQHLVGLSKP